MDYTDTRIEICCDGIEAARKAFEAGADRVELCRDLPIGGVTPPYDEIAVAAALGRPVNVLIRPRGGDFVYSPAEAMEIERGIACCARQGVNGVVIGALTHDRDVDMSLCKRLTGLAHRLGLEVTFHRAIDEAADILDALDKVLSLNVERILTSGGRPTALEGREVIAGMVRRAGGRTIIMPGSGVTADNARDILDATGAREIHGSRISFIKALRPTDDIRTD